MSDNGPLSDVIARYLQALDAGEQPEQSVWLARHPEHAEELRRFFAAQEKVQQIAAPLRDAVEQRPSQTVEAPAGAGLLEQTTPPIEPRPGPSAAAPVLPRAFGDYELLEEIGRGGMGVVYKARQAGLDRLVAVKMLSGGIDQEQAERLQQEARLLADLAHPHIVPVYTVGAHEGRLFFAMKLIPGGSLAGCLPALRGNLRRAVTLLLQIARAVHFAHQKGVLHRDLKPANILLETDGTPLLTDFGLARHLERDPALTQTGAVVGTPAYMAPEQATGDSRLTPAVDVYALGVILYEILTGRLPFQGESPLEVLHQVVRGVRVPPHRFEPGVNRELERVCLCCLARRAEDRYPSAAALADDLERWLAHRPVCCRPYRRLRAAGRFAGSLPRRRRLIVGLLLAMLVAGLGWVAWVADGEWRHRAAVERAACALQTGRLELARRLAPAPPSWLSWLRPSSLQRRQQRLREILAEHLFQPFPAPTFPGAHLPPRPFVQHPLLAPGQEPSVTLAWRWSEDGRFLVLFTLTRWPTSDDLKPIRMWDGWTGEDAPLGRIPSANGPGEAPVETVNALGLQGVPPVTGAFHFPRPVGAPPFRTVGGTWCAEGSLLHWSLWHSKSATERIRENPTAADLAKDTQDHLRNPQQATEPASDVLGAKDRDSLVQATYDLKRKCWVRLVASDFCVYRVPAARADGQSQALPLRKHCISLGRPRLLSLLEERGGEMPVTFRLSPDGTRLLTIWRNGDAADSVVHVWRMPGSEQR
jgi:predicted Ser/Thr protein kinase